MQGSCSVDGEVKDVEYTLHYRLLLVISLDELERIAHGLSEVNSVAEIARGLMTESLQQHGSSVARSDSGSNLWLLWFSTLIPELACFGTWSKRMGTDGKTL